jgi:hypothetical protein
MSSVWNWSKDFPLPGRTITLGPVGRVAHPPNASSARNENRLRVNLVMVSILPVRWTRRRNDLHPSVRTLFYVRIVALGVPAEIPIIRFLYFDVPLKIYVW